MCNIWTGKILSNAKFFIHSEKSQEKLKNCYALSAMLYLLCFISYALSDMQCFICNTLYAILYTQYFIYIALSAILYLVCFIWYALSAMLYLVCLICYALSGKLYLQCCNAFNAFYFFHYGRTDTHTMSDIVTS